MSYSFLLLGTFTLIVVASWVKSLARLEHFPNADDFNVGIAASMMSFLFVLEVMSTGSASSVGNGFLPLAVACSVLGVVISMALTRMRAAQLKAHKNAEGKWDSPIARGRAAAMWISSNLVGFFCVAVAVRLKYPSAPLWM